ncbi:MAG: hypothetical protein U1E39_11410 [Planctomycetota bacterium]
MRSAPRRALRSCVVVLATGALATLAACGKGDGAPAPGGAAAADVPVSGLRLLDAGRGERTPVRFRYAKGMKQALVLEGSTTFGASVPLPPVTTTMELTLEVTDVAADGTATIEGATGGMTMSGAPGGAPPAGLATLRTRTRTRMSPRGEILAIDVGVDAADVAPDLRAMLTAVQASVKESMGQIGVVWPEEPLGPGARWVFRRRMRTGMAEADVNVETTLVARDGDRLTLSSRMKVAMDPQDVEVPGSGRKLHLKGLTGDGTMEQTANLASLAQTLDLRLAMTMELDLELPRKEGATATPPPKLEFTAAQKVRPKD